MHNTFSTIIWLIEEDRKDNAISAIQKLSILLRESMDKGKRLVTIRNEAAIVQNYLEIQKLRYRDKFEYILYIDEDIMQCWIIPIVLQPLVENAIYHGIKNINSGGLIKIIGYKENDNVIIKVFDNGPADVNDINKINNLISKSSFSEELGIGITNVHLRIRHHFKKNYGLNYEKEGKFTVAVVTIPVIIGKEENV